MSYSEQDKRGNTSAHMAAKETHVSALREILKKGDKGIMKMKNSEGESALDILTETMKKVRRMRNPADNVYPSKVMEYLENKNNHPFVIDHGKKKESRIGNS